MYLIILIKLIFFFHNDFIINHHPYFLFFLAACASGVALIAVLFVKHYDLWKPEDEEKENKRNHSSK